MKTEDIDLFTYVTESKTFYAHSKQLKWTSVPTHVAIRGRKRTIVFLFSNVKQTPSGNTLVDFHDSTEGYKVRVLFDLMDGTA